MWQIKNEYSERGGSFFGFPFLIALFVPDKVCCALGVGYGKRANLTKGCHEVLCEERDAGKKGHTQEEGGYLCAHL